jgi:hypothetical protein
MPRTADVGPMIHEEVSKLVGQGMKKSDAFRQVAAEQLPADASEDERLKKERSVAANYYRYEGQEATVTPIKQPDAPEAVVEKVAEAVAEAPEVTVTSTPSSAISPPPKRRGRPRKQVPAGVADGQLREQLEAAEAIVKLAIEQARAQTAELEELRRFKAKVTSAVS